MKFEGGFLQSVGRFSSPEEAAQFYAKALEARDNGTLQNPIISPRYMTLYQNRIEFETFSESLFLFVLQTNG